MQRRKSLKERPTKSSRKKKKRSLSQSSKKDMTGKQKKRLSALEELMDGGSPEPVAVQQNVEEENVDTSEVIEESKAKGDGSDDGIFGKIKGFYEKADSMAASQALLLNKELEDRGVIEKITDETGLKVVGKEKAAAEAAKMKDDADAGEEKK